MGKRSLFQDTFLRCLKVCDADEVFVVTTQDQKFFVLGQVKELGYDIPAENILIEPVGKNTLPAITYAMAVIGSRYGSCNAAIFSSDHILDETAMERISEAEALAAEHLVTFGVVPASPHTGYGYINPGETLDVGYRVLEFKEKPDSDHAREYIEQGFLWNSGMFLFNTDVFFDQLARYEPDIHAAFCAGDLANVLNNIVSIYRGLPSVSVDYGIMERSDRVAVVRLEERWSDLGNFDSIFEEYEKNDDGNVSYQCDDIVVSSTGNLICSKEDKIVSLIDVNDMVVVDSPDALLICPRKSSQKVKDVVNILKEKNDERVILHQTVYRPWGTYTILENSPTHKIKNITVMPENSLSLQLHHHRSEHWVVVKGMACVQIGKESFFLRPGESTFITAGTKHRLSNPGKLPLEIIEVQLGECVDEDDIVRFDDDYGRAG